MCVENNQYYVLVYCKLYINILYNNMNDITCDYIMNIITFLFLEIVEINGEVIELGSFK